MKVSYPERPSSCARRLSPVTIPRDQRGKLACMIDDPLEATGISRRFASFFSCVVVVVVIVSGSPNTIRVLIVDAKCPRTMPNTKPNDDGNNGPMRVALQQDNPRPFMIFMDEK